MNQNAVLCAVDVNDYDQYTIDLAASFAKSYGVDLDLLHVTLSPDPTNAAWPAYVGAPNEMVRDHRLFRKLSTNINGVQVHFHHLSGLPETEVVQFVERNNPRLLVLGTHARKGVSRIFGSVAARIMRRVACPVLVYRQRKNSQSLDEVVNSTTQST